MEVLVQLLKVLLTRRSRFLGPSLLILLLDLGVCSCTAPRFRSKLTRVGHRGYLRACADFFGHFQRLSLRSHVHRRYETAHTHDIRLAAFLPRGSVVIDLGLVLCWWKTTASVDLAIMVHCLAIFDLASAILQTCKKCRVSRRSGLVDPDPALSRSLLRCRLR